MSVNTIKQPDLANVREAMEWVWSCLIAHDCYFGHGTDNPEDEAFYLVLGVLGLPWDIDDTGLDIALSSQQSEALLKAVHGRAIDKLPLPYILGVAWFCGLQFYVNPCVLIPRSPIAELIQKRFQPWLQQSTDLSIMDMCCGGACIAIACAVELDAAEVTAVDVSSEALLVAAQNVDMHDLGSRLTLVESDLFAGIKGEFHLIVSNPPYVSSEEMSDLPAEFHHEPVLALEAEESGLALVYRILAESAAYLHEEGILIVEVGNSMDALQQRFPEVPFLWLEFEHGGHGVFLLTKEQLQEYQQEFLSATACI